MNPTKEFRDYLISQGAALVGIGDLTTVPSSDYPVGIAVAVPLPKHIIKDLQLAPTREYYELYTTLNDKLNAIVTAGEEYLISRGYHAYALTTDRIMVDSDNHSSLPHKTVATRAGLGWIGKNTNLIIPGKGSFFFLGEIVTTLELDYDSPQENRCGDCRRCLDACPTGALESAGHLNANKCISYLTIEHKGDIPSELASRLGNRLYGCDTCQEVCPWNRFAVPTREEAFTPSPAFLSFKKEDLADFTREDYNRIFARSAVKRAKYEGLIRTIANKRRIINNKKDKP